MWGSLTLLPKLTVGPTDLSKHTVGPTVSYPNLLWGPLTLLSKVCGAHCLVQMYWGPLSLLSELTVGPTDSLIQTYFGAH